MALQAAAAGLLLNGHGTLNDAELVGLAFPDPSPSKKPLSEVEVMESQSGEIFSICIRRFAHYAVFARSSCMQKRKQYDISKVVFMITSCDLPWHNIKTLMVRIMLESKRESDRWQSAELESKLESD